MSTITRTDEEIAAEIKWLKDNKPQIPSHSSFGDDNWTRIDNAIEILESKQDLSDEFERRAMEDEGEDDEDANDIRMSAQDVYGWLIGDKDCTQPSEGWAALVGCTPKLLNEITNQIN